MKKSIVTLGILCCMLAGCQNKSHETTAMCQQQENQVVKTISWSVEAYVSISHNP